MTILGPLKLKHDDLWKLTIGEYEDLCHAWSYDNYLENQKIALLATWLLNGSGNLKYPVYVEDLVGRWVDGQVMTEKEYREYIKNKVARRKGGQ